MRLSVWKIFLWSLLAFGAGLTIFQIFSINRSVRQTLADERARLNTENLIPFEKRILTPHLSTDVKILQNTSETRDFVKFGEVYFAATSGGLVEYAADGKIIKHFTVLDGLPESDLTTLAVYQNKLYIGTRTKNLVAFDGEKFENFGWTNRKTQPVTALIEADGKLLIGTQNGGLLEFDGANFAEIKSENKTIKNITCIYQNEARLYVGTFDDGLWIRQSDTWQHFTNADGSLPSNRVVGIAAKDSQTYVAADMGLAVSDGKSFRTLAELPALSSLSIFGNMLFLSKDDGEIYTFEKTIKEFSALKNARNSRLIAPANENLLLLSDQGIAKIKGAKIKNFANDENLQSPTDNFISAMTLDQRGNLWVGSFRRGADIFNDENIRTAHLESENLREINFLAETGDTISAATSAGLIRLKDKTEVGILGKNEGLPSRSVTHFTGAYTATAKGLAFRDAGGKLRLLTTVQGLPNNSVYATLAVGKKLYAGTLGGLAEIENGRVTGVFKDSNSNLSTNWVTALWAADERLFIGTYGGGIFELNASGEIRSFSAEAGKFTVNPNALFSDGESLYAGTLSGVKILDLRRGAWRNLKTPLPSETVMSITGNGNSVYFGTTAGIARFEKSYFRRDETE